MENVNKLYIVFLNCVLIFSFILSYHENKNIWKPIYLLILLNLILSATSYSPNIKILININALIGLVCGYIIYHEETIGSIIIFVILYSNFLLNDCCLIERILSFLIVIGFVLLVPREINHFIMV